jgi:hypothetical protein
MLNEWPVVARPGQTVPTSSDVRFFRSSKFLLLDLEGEDGQTPRTLLEPEPESEPEPEQPPQDQEARPLPLLAARETVASQQIQMTKEQVVERLSLFKDAVPPLAYIVSDVMIFVQASELRTVDGDAMHGVYV